MDGHAPHGCSDHSTRSLFRSFTEYTSEAYGELVAQAVGLFVDATPALAPVPVVLAGESYAGHWIPSLAAVLRPPPVAVLIGNGWTAPATQWGAEASFAKAHSPPLKVISSQLSTAAELCDRAQGEGNATATANICSRTLELLMEWNPDVDPTNILNPCPNYSCFDKPSWDAITSMLNATTVRAALGVPSSTPSFAMCSEVLGGDVYDEDRVRSAAPLLSRYLVGGGSVVLYAGAEDLVCDAGGVLATARGLVWPGRTAFATAPTVTSWHANATVRTAVAGSARLAYVEVKGAGHQVPADQGDVALAILETALSGWWARSGAL
jgi:carboxypeptidase C (cathepsin A)